ncbi:MAG: V-type ATP synthase subunit D [Pseudomonadota bacterium]
MVRVSKGELRSIKLKVARLERAIPTLDLRRKQLNREILDWERKFDEQEKRVIDLKRRFSLNPHDEIESLVEISDIKTSSTNIAGVVITLVESVDFKPVEYSRLITPPSFDKFVELRKKLFEEENRLEFLSTALELLEEELTITTQRINLFEKRLVPKGEDDIRYIKGRLEDGERASVMVAKIAQGKLLGEQHVAETA